jgi:hypothetical protein
MLIPPIVLALAGFAVGVLAMVPSFGAAVERAALRFQDAAGYGRAVLGTGKALPGAARPAILAPVESADVTATSVGVGLACVAGAVTLAWVALYWRRLPVLRRGYEPGAGLSGPIRRFQSGILNDYVTWLVLGVACLGGLLALVTVP